MFDSIAGPTSSRSSPSTSSPTSTTHCGLPTLTCRKRHERPADSIVPVPSGGPDGYSGEVTEARPIAIETVPGAVIVGVTGPAIVITENVSSSVQPDSRR